MATTVAILSVSALLLAVLVAWLYSERENRKERKALLDRIQAPMAAQFAAFPEIGTDTTKPPEDPYDEPVPSSDDLLLDDLMAQEVR